uniref:ATPase family AAA domain containing 5a n=1 Tax=Oreochromis niloticus TaxID=8128 RepID=I3J1H3_ORENI
MAGVVAMPSDEAEEDREDEEVKDDDCKITNETKETNSGELDISKSEENMVPEELPSFQVSPRTVTIQAQVHVSPKQEPSKAVGKLASIFNRKKGGRSPAERFSSSHAEAGHQLPSLTTKRKSNVVLQEEDLELAVLESESIPKCSEVERKQFMAAFKQPTADVSKSKPVKSQSKQKQPGEKSLDAAEAETENLLTVEQTSQPSQGKKATKKKPGKKGGKKAKEGEETVSASPAAAGAAAEEETANMTVEVEEKRPESPITTSPSTPALRRSRREAVVQKASETTPTSSLRKTRRQTQTESKDTDVTALLQPEDGPIKMSTPKTRKSKYGVFQSELMCPPDDKESPISESKKREQAKKLVQKAKVIQQNKKTVEEKSSLRRSSRTSIKRTELELSVSSMTECVLFLQSRSLVEEPGCWELLTDCKRRGVDLLYSNMEILLPLPLTHLTTSTRNPEQCASVSQDQPSASPKEQPSSTLPSTESADCSDSSSPIKMSNRMRKNKRRHHLPDQAGVDSDSDSEDGFLSLCKPQNAPQAKEEFKASERAKRKPLTPEERLKSLPVSQCLESIADFLDSMSYMDSLLDRANSHRGLSPVSVVIKDGMTDESSVEIDRGSSMTAAGLEIQAAVEALSFHKCRVSAEEAWEKTRQLEGELAKEVAAELSLPVAAHQECFSFTQDGSSQPQLVEQRREVMESLMLKGVFGTLGNSPAAALDYLPIMRCICRSEQLKEQGKVKRRFLHYLDAIHLGLEKRTLQLLAEDFP